MSQLEGLTQEGCPRALERKPLHELGCFYNGLSGKTKQDFIDGNAKYITYMNVYSNPAVNIHTDALVRINSNEKQNTVAQGDILFTTSSEILNECGMSSVVTAPPEEPTYLNSFCFGFRLSNLSLFDLNFLKHLLHSHAIRKEICKCASGVTRFNVSKKKLANVKIPIPLLEEQERIVAILDKYSSIKAQLINQIDREIELTLKQYNYYLTTLLCSDHSSMTHSKRSKLGDICEVQRGVRLVKKQLSEEGLYPVYQNRLAPLGYYDKSNRPANTPFIICAGSAGKIGFSSTSFWAADDCTYFITPDSLNDKYLYYLLKANQRYFDSKVRTASVPRISNQCIRDLEVSMPSLEEQERIVDILDKYSESMDKLVSNLRREKELVQKQYEYYREKLLTF